ncbi:hypothetical protein ABEF93_008718 [Exophiala dermatitidis]
MDSGRFLGTGEPRRSVSTAPGSTTGTAPTTQFGNMTNRPEYHVQTRPQDAHTDSRQEERDTTNVDTTMVDAVKEENAQINSRHDDRDTTIIDTVEEDKQNNTNAGYSVDLSCLSDATDVPASHSQTGNGPSATVGLNSFPRAALRSQSSRHRARFDRSWLLPDRNLPLKAQIMEQVKDWAELGSMIENDQRRNEVLDRAFLTLRNVWCEALRQGLVASNDSAPMAAESMPQSIRTGSGSQMGSNSAAMVTGSIRQTSRTGPNSQTGNNSGPGRPANTGKIRQRPPRDPKLYFLHKTDPRDTYTRAVTFGELEEAGVSPELIRQRAESGDLQGGDELLDAVLKHLGRRDIRKMDWFRLTRSTNSNLSGRNIMLWALHEVQLLRQSMKQLESFYQNFSQDRQRENTDKRIKEEKERHDLLMALALEVDKVSPWSIAKDKPMYGTGVSRFALLPPPSQQTLNMAAVAPATDMSSREERSRKRPLTSEDVDVVDIEVLPPTKKQMTDQAGGMVKQRPKSSDGAVGNEPTDTRPALQGEQSKTNSADQPARPNRGSVAATEGVGAGEKIGPSLIAKLKDPSGFHPKERLTEKLYEHKGFRFQYATDSTMAEREAMDEVLDAFVRKQAKAYKDWVSNTGPKVRFKQFHTLSHPDDPRGKTIISGLWGITVGSGPPTGSPDISSTANGKKPDGIPDQSTASEVSNNDMDKDVEMHNTDSAAANPTEGKVSAKISSNDKDKAVEMDNTDSAAEPTGDKASTAVPPPDPTEDKASTTVRPPSDPLVNKHAREAIRLRLRRATRGQNWTVASSGNDNSNSNSHNGDGNRNGSNAETDTAAGTRTRTRTGTDTDTATKRANRTARRVKHYTGKVAAAAAAKTFAPSPLSQSTTATDLTSSSSSSAGRGVRRSRRQTRKRYAEVFLDDDEDEYLPSEPSD